MQDFTAEKYQKIGKTKSCPETYKQNIIKETAIHRGF